MSDQYDVFLSHNSSDKPAVIRLAEELRRRGLKVWLDAWELVPGQPWQEAIEEIIRTAKSAAVLVGGDGLGPWEEPEMRACLSQFVKREMPVIPVLLPGAPQQPELPVFLSAFTWVDLRDGPTEAGIDRLVWGITGKKPAPSPPPPGKPDVWFSPSWPQMDPALFGREEELAELDAAWEDPNTAVVSFVAAGGIGKTALVDCWVNRHMQPDGWRGAQRVFAWSFYSQGSEEGRQASADPFVDKALRWFGDEETADSARSGWDKGERLAELVRQRHTLLLLDGLEPHQEPGTGRLKDPALQTLLRFLARRNPGLCVVSTRLELSDLKPHEGVSVRAVDLDVLSADAGAAYLKQLGVNAPAKELKEVVHEYGGHALALTLLGTYVKIALDGDIRKRDQIRDLATEEIKHGGHARRVMTWYEQLYAGKPELDVLNILGLFDRPAEPGAIAAVRARPPITGLTEQVVEESKWHYALEALSRARLIRATGTDGPLDCHPLLREHFGQRLRISNLSAWQEAHNRLYEYYCRLPEEEQPETLAKMQPLFQAVVHACQAGRLEQALAVYKRRILRGRYLFGTMKLGAIGEESAMLAAFFDVPWARVAQGLSDRGRISVQVRATVSMRALGRAREAIRLARLSVRDCVRVREWEGAAVACGCLSKIFLVLGETRSALESANDGVKYADLDGNPYLRKSKLGNRAEVLHQMGQFDEARLDFEKGERIQGEDEQWEHESAFLFFYSLWRFRYCELLLTLGRYQEAQRRAQKALRDQSRQRGLLDEALDYLALGRAQLLTSHGAGSNHFDEPARYVAIAVDGLRKAGHEHETPRGLLASAEVHRVRGDFELVREHLDATYEIATRGGMRLFECDVHLECCRLPLAMVEAGETFEAEQLGVASPLALFDAAGDPRAAARGHLEKAAEMIQEMGYHRRDREVEELRGRCG